MEELAIQASAPVCEELDDYGYHGEMEEKGTMGTSIVGDKVYRKVLYQCKNCKTIEIR